MACRCTRTMFVFMHAEGTSGIACLPNIQGYVNACILMHMPVDQVCVQKRVFICVCHTHTHNITLTQPGTLCRSSGPSYGTKESKRRKSQHEISWRRRGAKVSMRFPGDDESKDERPPCNCCNHLATAALGELGIYALRLETSTGAQQS